MSNTSRVLSSVIAMDAWHEPFVATRTSSKVSVDLTFTEGRMGGDHENFPFTFKLGLKRAKLSVILSEPLTIARNSIARNVPDTQVEQTKLRSARSIISGDAKAQLSINPASFAAALSGGAASKHEIKKEDELKIVQTVPPILVITEPVSRSEYRWTLEPTFMPTLIGQPWDPSETPRFSARYDAAVLDISNVVIKAELSCALEDLDISEITPKQPTLQEKLLGRMDRDSRTAAAEQHIRHILWSSNLEPGRMDNRFSSMMIASVLATVEAE